MGKIKKEVSEKKYILGGGIAGLIWGFYHKDFFIIAPKIGGQLNNNFKAGPRFLHRNKFSRKLLKDLDMPIDPITVKVGYLKKGCRIVNKIPENFMEKYYKKSRGAKIGNRDNDEKVLSGSKTELKVYNVDFVLLVKKLKEHLKDRIIKKNVYKICTEENYFLCENENEKFKYDFLISTIPLNIFCRISDVNFEDEDKLISESITYVLCKNFLPRPVNINYFYDITDNVFHRATFEKNNVILDILGKYSEEKLHELFGDNYIDSIVLDGAQIFPIKKCPEINNVKFSGRYGAWDRNYKTETVIEDALTWRCKNGRN